MTALVPVDGSSNIKAVGYDRGARHLDVQFHSGAIHRHYDVDPHAHAALMASESKGKYFHRWIKGQYRSERVDEA
jgi:hypothetical protein